MRVVQSLALHAPDTVARVLIIEEERGEAQSLARHLEGCEIEVHKVGSSEAALRALERQSFRCVVLDLGLPNSDAPKLLQALQERSGVRRPSVVVYSRRVLSDAERQRMQAYADAVVVQGEDDAKHVLEEVREFALRLHDGEPVTRKTALDSSLRLDGLKLLLVDDDMRTVYALSALLSGKGATVRVADTGRAALTELDENPDVDIVLMDIMMPEMDGHEAMRNIRKDARFKQLHIVALTAKAMKGDSERCLESGATDYLPKPIDPDRLVSLLKSTMSQQRAKSA
jgi:CheY-like chemotaxis protein